MNTQIVALSISVGLIVSLGFLSLLIGALERYLGKPSLKILKSVYGPSGFAFVFDWNNAKEPVAFDEIKIELFNPQGEVKQVEVVCSFDKKNETFAMDVNGGERLARLMRAIDGKIPCRVMVEIYSTIDGISHQEQFSGVKFKAQIEKALYTVEEYMDKFAKEEVAEENDAAKSEKFVFGVIHRDNMADVIPGKGAQLALPTNPGFAKFFAGGPAGGAAGGGDAAGGAAAQENFPIKKVWIAPGCIVCNACENIYPEVFEVLADTCIIRPNPPLDDGLRIQEASDACPVEVIKFEKVS